MRWDDADAPRACDQIPPGREQMSTYDRLAQLERVVQEIEALQAIYGSYDDEGIVVHSEAELLLAQTIVEAGVLEAEASPSSSIKLDIELKVALGEDGPVARLRCGLPPGYPEAAAAVVSVSVVGLRRLAQDELSRRLAERSEALLGEEAVMELVQELQEIAPALITREHAPTEAAAARDAATEVEGRGGAAVILSGRRWIWVHHIKDSGRKSAIVSEAAERNLGGYLKPGYPGVVVVEGPAPACDSFVAWIKGSKSRPGGFGRNWAHHVRGEIATAAGSRQLPTAFEMLGEGMDELALRCRQHGLEAEFLQHVMQHKPEPEPEPEIESSTGTASSHNIGPCQAASSQPPAVGMGSCARTFLYAHHIRTKQALVYAWAAELQLSGRVKIGETRTSGSH